MLLRYLLYTAVTRAKRLVALVGSKRAIRRAVRTEGAGRRYAMQVVNLRLQDTNDAARS
jgi:ATP-dependent exoDNAse (exonuclease V) alpha subunit